jgi:hypothetical protein
VVDAAFEGCHVEVLKARHFASNPSSGAVMRAAGFYRLERRLEKDASGVGRESFEYRHSRALWLAAREDLFQAQAPAAMGM